MDVTVECYAGYRGEETPRRFRLGHRGLDVVDVLDRWLAPDHRYFKVRADDGSTYILRHDIGSGTWALAMFESAAGRRLLGTAPGCAAPTIES